MPDRWRDRAGAGSGLWYDLGPHLVDQAVQLFGAPLAVHADLAQQRDGAQATDYFHVQLRYRRLRVVLHAGALVPAAALPAHGLRFAVHGTGGSWIKHGLDPQEDALRAGMLPGGEGWGHDPRPGTWLRAGDDGVQQAPSPAPAGDYPAYYARLRDAILEGTAPPVTGEEALTVMRVIEAGLRSDAGRREVPFPDERTF